MSKSHTVELGDALGRELKFLLDHLVEGGLNREHPELTANINPFLPPPIIDGRLEVCAFEGPHRYLLRIELFEKYASDGTTPIAAETAVTLALIQGNVPEIKLSRRTDQDVWEASFVRMDDLHPGHPMLDIADQRESCKLNAPGAGELAMKLGYLFERGRLPT